MAVNAATGIDAPATSPSDGTAMGASAQDFNKFLKANQPNVDKIANAPVSKDLEDHFSKLASHPLYADPKIEAAFREQAFNFIEQSMETFKSVLPGNTDGKSMVSAMIEKMKQPPPDPSDPGAHVLEPDT